MCIVKKIAGVLASIGAINWGLFAFVNFNLVEFLKMEVLMNVAYGLIALSGIYLLVKICTCCGNSCSK